MTKKKMERRPTLTGRVMALKPTQTMIEFWMIFFKTVGRWIKKNIFNSFSTKVALLVAVLLVLYITISSAYPMIRMLESQEQQFLTSSEAIVNTYAQTTYFLITAHKKNGDIGKSEAAKKKREAEAKRNLKRLQFVLTNVIRALPEGQITDAVVVDKKGIVLAAKDLDQAGTELEDGEELLEVTELTTTEVTTDLMNIRTPVQYADGYEPEGWVRFFFSKSIIQAERDDIIEDLIWFLLGMVLSGFFLVYLLVGLAMRRVKTLVQYIRDKQEGKEVKPLSEPKGKDEIDQLKLEIRQAYHVQEMVERYVDRNTVSLILHKRIPEKLVYRKVIVSFFDIRRFTRLANHYGEENPDLVLALDELFDMIQEVALAHGGFISKYMGDGLLILWGIMDKEEGDIELTQEDAHRAYLGTFIILFLLHFQAFSKFELQNLFPFLPRIGIGMGPCWFGPMGAKKFREISVKGRLVNAVSRFEGRSKVGRFVSDHFLALLGGELVDKDAEKNGISEKVTILVDGATKNEVRPFIDIAESEIARDIKGYEGIPMQMHHTVGLSSQETNDLAICRIWKFAQAFNFYLEKNLKEDKTKKLWGYIQETLGVSEDGKFVDAEGKLSETGKKLVLPAPRDEWDIPLEGEEGKK